MSVPFGTFCSGIGAPEVAALGLGFHPVFNSEIEPFPSRVLAHHFPGVPNLGDFTAIGSEWLDQIRILVAGTPCQAFSVAGLRRSLDDDRGNLTLQFVKKVHAAKSLFCALWENVPGVLSTDDNAFGCFLGALVGANDPLLPTNTPPRGQSTRAWTWRKAGKFPVLDDEGNETGEFVEKPAGHVAKWPSAGMVAGPLGRAAWRVFNAQYFGVPQRRRRVLLVFCPASSGGDPAAILFEPKSLSGDFAEGRQSRKDVTGTLSARAQGGGGLGTDFEAAGGLRVALPLTAGMAASAHRMPQEQGALIPVAFGGNNCAGAIDVSTCLNSHGGPHGRLDFESETFVAYRTSGNNGAWTTGDRTDALTTGADQSSHVIEFALRGREDGAQPEVSGEVVNALRAATGGSSRDYVAWSIMPQNSGKDFKAREVDILQPLMAGGPVCGNQGGDYIQHAYGVRRLLPVECERLQGFPDGHTDMQSNRPSDGPRYKGCGNSMAVPKIRWLWKRIKADMQRCGEWRESA